MEIATINTTEGAAYGAALLASVGAGVYPSVESACETAIQVTRSALLVPRQVRTYERIYPLYRNLYPVLKSSFWECGIALED